MTVKTGAFVPCPPGFATYACVLTHTIRYNVYKYVHTLKWKSENSTLNDSVNYFSLFKLLVS